MEFETGHCCGVSNETNYYTFEIYFCVSCTLRRCRFGAKAPIQEVHGIVVSSIDPSVKPGDDFYHFANGNWINRAKIPADRAAIDVWTKLGDLSNQRTADLIKEIAASNPPARLKRPQGGGSLQFLYG